MVPLNEIFLFGALILISVVSGGRRPTTVKPMTGITLNAVTEIYKFEAGNTSWNQVIVSGFKLSHTAKNYRGYDADIYFKSDLPSVKKFSFVFKQCKEVVSFNTCEKSMRWLYDQSPCSVLNNKDAIWADVLRVSTPPYQCPFPAGTTYRFRNFSILNPFKLYPPMDLSSLATIWESEVLVFNEHNKKFANLTVAAKFIPIGLPSKT